MKCSRCTSRERCISRPAGVFFPSCAPVTPISVNGSFTKRIEGKRPQSEKDYVLEITMYFPFPSFFPLPLESLLNENYREVIRERKGRQQAGQLGAHWDAVAKLNFYSRF